jgi:spermidine/putrescine transport system permease protein
VSEVSEATAAGAVRAPAPAPPSAWNRIRGWLANPWGQPRLSATATWVYVIWSIVPLVIAIAFSFNGGRSRTSWQGFSFRWYATDPDLSVLHDPTMYESIVQTVKLAAGTMLIATPIGVALALGLARWRGRGSGSSNFLMLFPLVTPEIVMGAALLLVFTNLYSAVPVGTSRQLLGHITFSISYVVIVVRGRLLSIGKDYEEAAMDLGASPIQAMKRVLLPLLAPAIFASLTIVFAISVDDFVISQYLSAGESTVTVPMRIYANGRSGPTPALNALASVMLLTTLTAVTVGYSIMRWGNRRQGGGGGDRELADVGTLRI